MALREKKAEAIRMRISGASYSQIKKQINIGKGTLSAWLHDFPLSTEQLIELRDKNPLRIERYRETRRRQREARWQHVKERAMTNLHTFSDREVLIGGLFLYWGEGGKTNMTRTALSNTDPAMISFFIHWLGLLGVPKQRLRVHLHLYADMDIASELGYWSRSLDIPLSNFRKSYVKKSKQSQLTYTQKFRHGTCNLIFENRDTAEYVLLALQVIRERFAAREAM